MILFLPNRFFNDYQTAWGRGMMKSWGNRSGIEQNYYKTFILRKKGGIAKMMDSETIREKAQDKVQGEMIVGRH